MGAKDVACPWSYMYHSNSNSTVSRTPPPLDMVKMFMVKLHASHQSRVAPAARKKVAPTAQGAPAVTWLFGVG